MTRIKIIACLFFLLSLQLQAQEKTNSHSKITYNASYFGNNIWNPGIKVGGEYTWKEMINEKTIQRKNGEKLKTINNQILIDGNIGFYWDPNSHIGVFTNYGFKYLKTYTKGFQYQIGLNPIGYYRSFLHETYKVSDNLEVEKVILPGRSYYAPSFNIGIGKYRKGKRLNAWFLNINAMFLIPYNTGFVPLINIEYGYKFKLHKNEK